MRSPAKTVCGSNSAASRRRCSAGWTITHNDDGVVFARPGRSRLDVSQDTEFPFGNAVRYARQIRQDIWRALQDQPGFSPIVEVSRSAEGMRVRAGGQIDRKFPRAHLEARIKDVLEDPALRARWIRWAGGAQHA